ncbi:MULTISPECIES: FAD-dependent thymidylate synthase [Clostridium]|uniref:Flavin-dependent thymidylate synthase n=1 Tax=Clostridium novyi (strain NT) TaxID=386415 RepID=A0PXS7_CLONN|nr:MULTISPECIES: FAD-dependent thymidylate synthase [Clostridium]ABK61425.1 thymidylate synthase, flavin-dependent [Clostridium novyi NT]KEH85370.1 FAD-dependent thymidylate synthase [Clostridium novyi A str. NCTC 538]KEH86650.1 FAD-dependent thymidylate synthase [Clostridium novyi A str. 4540]KEH92376.1 FAD-dependent thymidylate synthase [Clostridium botulinum C/D str. It1]KEH92814.1 FAD-dependent thymidylate synthase [Clostridium novyi A str. GD211209]
MALKVKLIEYTPNPEKVIASAAKLCYSASSIDDILEGLDEGNVESFLQRLMSYGHASPIEHVSFTFGVEGVSRSLTHQLVRHRIASYSQQSQRYVKLNQFEYIVPPEIEKDDNAKKIFVEAMENSQKAYDKIVDILREKHIESGMKKLSAEKKAIEDARYVFPNACETKIVLTMNARSLMNFFEHRCCNRAQWEIHALADEMLKQVRKVAPILFKKAGPSCVKGRCPEGTMTCGHIEEVRTKYS